MLTDNFFNFQIFKDRAADYRLSLRNDNRIKEEKLLERTFLSLNSNFEDIRFYNIRRSSVFDAIELSKSYKDFATAFLYTTNVLNETRRKINQLNNTSKNYLKLLNKDLKILKSEVKKTDLKLNSHFNKVKIYNLFQDIDTASTKDLYDYKTRLSIKKDYQSSYKKDGIASALHKSVEIGINTIEILHEESFGGSNLQQINVTKDLSFIHRDNKIFNYIVGNNIYEASGRKNNTDVFSLAFVIHFNGYQDINNLYINSASSLPISFDLSNFYYCDEDNNWQPLTDAKEVDLYNRKQIVFNRITTKKIKIKLFQTKYIDTSIVKSDDHLLNSFYKDSYLNFTSKIDKPVVQHIYDFSLADIKVYLNTYKGYGFYIESDVLPLVNPLSVDIDYDLLYEDSDTYIETEANIVLYGNKDYYSINKTNSISTPRYNNTIPVPQSSSSQHELLIFNSLKEANLSLFPYMNLNSNLTLNDIITVYNNRQPLTIGTHYTISFDSGGIFYNDSSVALKSILEQVKTKIAGNCIIKLSSNLNLSNKYTVTYKLDTNFFLSEDKMLSCSNSKIIFNKELYQSVGYVQTKFIFRNLSKYKESSIIKEYKVLVEEDTVPQDFYIEPNELIEFVKQGISNVV